MPIENIDCPQFVDFTSGEAFMMDDGADFCFDKRVVGSDEVGLDLGFSSCRPGTENRTKVLKENNPHSEKGNSDMTSTHHLLLTPKKPAALENKENISVSGVGVSKVGSALDLINAKQSAISNNATSHNNHPQVFSEHNKPPSAQCNQASNGSKSRIRTLSSANAVPPKPTTEKSNNNVLPISGYKGIRFLPKQPMSTPSKDKKQVDAKKSAAATASANTTATNISTSEAKSQHQPRIVGSLFDSTNGKPEEIPSSKPANLLRATSVKSYSNKLSATPSTTNSVTSKPPNLIATLKSNLMRVRTQAKPPAGPVPSSSISSHDLSSMMSKKLNMNESANSSRLNGSMMMRKKSESKSGGGLLHTEMRAMKRSEYDQAMREKERIAQQMRAQIEAQRAQQEHEELTRLRSQSVVKAQPPKHYKPIDIKPSELPLTAPRSPNLRLARSNSRSNITTSTSSLPNNQSHLSQNNYQV